MVDRTSATIEHTTNFGLKVRNVAQYANYDRMYQDIYPGGPYDPNTGLVPIIAYNNIGDREDLFNQSATPGRVTRFWPELNSGIRTRSTYGIAGCSISRAATAIA